MELRSHRLTPGLHPHGIRRLVRVGKRQAPLPIRDATSAGPAPGLHPNAFRGEPAISGFAWHFTPTHSSSGHFATCPGAALHGRVPPASAWPWVAHPVSGRFGPTPGAPATRSRAPAAPRRPFGLAFAPAPPVPGLASPARIT